MPRLSSLLLLSFFLLLLAPGARGCEAARGAGYSGPPIASSSPVVVVEAWPGLTWWALGRRYAMDYALLARMNGRSEGEVRGGALRAGTRVFVLDRRGALRRGRVRGCDVARAPGDGDWMLFPEAVAWRSPGARAWALPPREGAPAPALLTGDAVWHDPAPGATFLALARGIGMARDVLLRFNGLDPARVPRGATPRARVALYGGPAYLPVPGVRPWRAAP